MDSNPDSSTSAFGAVYVEQMIRDPSFAVMVTKAEYKDVCNIAFYFVWLLVPSTFRMEKWPTMFGNLLSLRFCYSAVSMLLYIM